MKVLLVVVFATVVVACGGDDSDDQSGDDTCKLTLSGGVSTTLGCSLVADNASGTFEFRLTSASDPTLDFSWTTTSSASGEPSAKTYIESDFDKQTGTLTSTDEPTPWSEATDKSNPSSDNGAVTLIIKTVGSETSGAWTDMHGRFDTVLPRPQYASGDAVTVHADF